MQYEIFVLFFIKKKGWLMPVAAGQHFDKNGTLVGTVCGPVGHEDFQRKLFLVRLSLDLVTHHLLHLKIPC